MLRSSPLSHWGKILTDFPIAVYRDFPIPPPSKWRPPRPASHQLLSENTMSVIIASFSQSLFNFIAVKIKRRVFQS